MRVIFNKLYRGYLLITTERADCQLYSMNTFTFLAILFMESDTIKVTRILSFDSFLPQLFSHNLRLYILVFITLIRISADIFNGHEGAS